MPDDTGVTTRTATRLSLIEAIRGARPAERGWRRRWSATVDAELADAILAALPEARPDPEVAELRERLAAAQSAVAELTWPPDMIMIAREYLDMLAERAARLQEKVTAVRPLLERFAEPGTMSATARRQAAAEAVRALDAAAGEAVAAGEPA